MSLKLPPDDLAFVLRVHCYCRDGLSQPEMARRENQSLTSFRDRMRDCGVRVQTTRRVVRTGTGETLQSLLDAGQVATDGGDVCRLEVAA
jgi:hypothetical protein